jgi:hypothetical protein
MTTQPLPVHEQKRGVVLGYIAAALVPIVGFIVGVVLATRNDGRARYGWEVMTLSVVMYVVWVAIVMGAWSGSPQDSYAMCRQQGHPRSWCMNEFPVDPGVRP